MKIEDFARIVKDSVIKQLGSDWQVTVKRTNKNNSVTYTGLKIRKSDSDISPLIYLDNQYKKLSMWKDYGARSCKLCSENCNKRNAAD